MLHVFVLLPLKKKQNQNKTKRKQQNREQTKHPQNTKMKNTPRPRKQQFLKLSKVYLLDKVDFIKSKKVGA